MIIVTTNYWLWSAIPFYNNGYQYLFHISWTQHAPTISNQLWIYSHFPTLPNPLVARHFHPHRTAAWRGPSTFARRLRWRLAAAEPQQEAAHRTGAGGLGGPQWMVPLGIQGAGDVNQICITSKKMWKIYENMGISLISPGKMGKYVDFTSKMTGDLAWFDQREWMVHMLHDSWCCQKWRLTNKKTSELYH